MATSAAATGGWTVNVTNTSLVGRLKDKLHILAGATGSTTSANVARGGVWCTSSDSSFIWYDLLPAASAAAGTLQVLVNSGGGNIPRAGQATYEFVSQGQKTVTLTAANATNPRIDRISARIYDPAQGDSPPAPLTSAGGVLFEVTDGTPAGSPVAPALPANSIPIATVLVPANAVNSSSLTVTDLRNATGTPGAVRPLLPGDTGFTGVGSTSPAGFMNGELLDVGTGIIYRWSGGVWRPLAQYSAGTYTPTWSGMSNNAGVAAGRFYLSGNMCTVTVTHTANASTSLGTGNIGFTVPFTSANIASTQWSGEAFVTSGTGISYMIRATLGANTSAGNLWAWSNTNISRGEINTPGTAGVIYGNGGFICASFTYEIA